MKRRVLFSFLIIAMAMAAITGGTLAWFTDSADLTDNVFQTGTVEIEAGSEVVLGNVEQLNLNPGDTFSLELTVDNVGTKGVHLHTLVEIVWDQDNVWEGEVDPVEGALTWSLAAGMDNTWQILDGYLYYIGTDGILAANENVDLHLTITLDGPLADNNYQDKIFDVKVTFQAIQTTNEAVVNEWNVEWAENEWESAE